MKQKLKEALYYSKKKNLLDAKKLWENINKKSLNTKKNLNDKTFQNYFKTTMSIFISSRKRSRDAISNNKWQKLFPGLWFTRRPGLIDIFLSSSVNWFQFSRGLIEDDIYIGLGLIFLGHFFSLVISDKSICHLSLMPF